MADGKDITVHIEGLPNMHFPLGTPPDVIQAAVKKQVAAKGGAKAPEEPSFISRLWEAANRPVGEEGFRKKGITGGLPEQMRLNIGKFVQGLNISDDSKRKLFMALDIPGELVMSVPEAGRRMTTPLGVATMGAGSLLQYLRQLPNVSPALKAMIGGIETTTGAGFGASGAQQALTGKQKGETNLDEIERRLTGLGQAVMGGTSLAHVAKPSVEGVGQVIPKSRVQVEDFVHKGGLATREHLRAAVTGARNQIGALAEDVSNRIDQAHPEGVIDAAAITKDIRSDMQQIVKLPEPKVPTAVSRITETPEVRRTTGPRVMGQHIDLSNPAHRQMFEKIKGAFTPEEIARMEGEQPAERWKFEEAKQIRTEVGSAMNNQSLSGPMRATARLAYRRLTEGLRQAAIENNMVRQWEFYNRLNRTLQDRLDGKLGQILDTENGRDVARRLIDDPAFTRELFRDLAKYGLDVEAVSRFTKYADKAERALQKGIIRHWPAAIFGWYFGRMFGVPWAESAMAAGYGAPLVRLMRAAQEAQQTTPIRSTGEEVIRQRSFPEGRQ